MPTPLDRDKIRKYLENVDLRSLFIEELGWDHGGTNAEATVAGRTFMLKAIAKNTVEWVAETERTPTTRSQIIPPDKKSKV